MTFCCPHVSLIFHPPARGMEMVFFSQAITAAIMVVSTAWGTTARRSLQWHRRIHGIPRRWPWQCHSRCQHLAGLGLEPPSRRCQDFLFNGFCMFLSITVKVSISLAALLQWQLSWWALGKAGFVLAAVFDKLSEKFWEHPQISHDVRFLIITLYIYI